MPEKKTKFLLVGILVALIVLVLFFFSAQVTAFSFEDSSGLKNTGWKAGYDIEGGGEEGVNILIGTVITAILSFAGVVFLVLMIYGGFIWMSDRGNEDKVEKAKKLITAAVVGLIIVMASYAISYFVISALQNPTIEDNTENPSNIPSDYNDLEGVTG